ncbi:MAG: Gfo/Idh/MocA family oxidoreductase, partial [Acidobacteria bacterium]|nr:Gfo/Idh/MocA family oxidoreductase [Acidobacteriota bacterium]
MTAASYSRILGANERVQVAVIGTGARGAGYVRSLRSNTSVTVTGLCDIYGRKVEAARQFAPEAAVFSDHRRVLDMKNLDAVFITTPDHWHVPISLDAVSAGKDVYCEK